MAMNADPNIPLYLFAKAPRPGQVKTRLQPQLTAEQSALLAQTMLQHSVHKVMEHWRGKLVLAVTPTMDYPQFRTLSKRYSLDLELQIHGSLGDRLYHVLAKGISKSGCCVVMGCDVPHIDGSVLRQVYHRLCNGENIIGPAMDGGFYLLGLNRIESEIFENVSWGKDSVYQSVCDNLADFNFDIGHCQTLRDIDTLDDLKWLAKRHHRYSQFVDSF